jgi:hypothetical protein
MAVSCQYNTFIRHYKVDMTLVTLIAFILSLTFQISYSQILTGHVTDGESQTDFIGLTIYLFQGDSLLTGTVSDEQGNYSIKIPETGIYDLKMEFIGYRNQVVRDLKLESTKTKKLDITFPEPCIISEYQLNKICPNGHKDGIIPIVYGLPKQRTMRKAEKGKLRLGGCIITGCDPKWYCKKHEIEF